MLLSEARTQVYYYVDDEDQERWTPTEVNSALKSALNEIMIDRS